MLCRGEEHDPACLAHAERGLGIAREVEPLDADQVLKVDTGHVAMFEPTVAFDIEMMRGFRNILFGGEGLFLATLRGPGRVWLQTMPTMNLARAIAKYIPSGGSGGGNSGGFNINLGGD